MQFIGILLHIGQIVKTAKDIEKAVADLITGKPSKDDIISLIDDLKSLCSMINIPGLNSDQLKTILSDLEQSI